MQCAMRQLSSSHVCSVILVVSIVCLRRLKLSSRNRSMHARIRSCHFNLHSGSLLAIRRSRIRQTGRQLCSITHGLCAFLATPCRHGQDSFCCLQTGNGSKGISSVACDLPQHMHTSSVLQKACTHDTSDRGGYLHAGFAQGTDRGGYLHAGFAQDPDRDNWLRGQPTVVRQERLQVGDLASADDPSGHA